MAKPSRANTRGLGVDAWGQPAVDPTENVLDKVRDAVTRLDDIAVLEREHSKEVAALEREHFRDMTTLERSYLTDLRGQRERNEAKLEVAREKLALAESARLDAIHAADVAAADRQATVGAAQQATLATQVETTAVTLRNQVEATRVATSEQLTQAIAPLQTSIAELTRALYSGEGAVAQKRQGQQNSQWTIGAVLAAALVFVALITFLLSHYH
jgi:hypothetical protein